MSKMKVERKPDGWWLEIQNDCDQGVDAAINLGEHHGPLVERALTQMEVFQKDNSEDIKELEQDNTELREVISKINDVIVTAREDRIIS